jgi:hypothetical protein
MIRGVYYDGPETRSLKTFARDGLTLTLTDSQLEALEAMARLATHASRAEMIPMFLSAETVTGKTEVALNAAFLLLNRISSNLRQLHAVYVAPTRSLAAQVEQRFRAFMADYFGDVRMLAVSGQDLNKKEIVREVFSVFAADAKTVLSTNPQFLASLATKSAKHYGLESRSSHFQLAAALAEANIIILDEPHFYVGKSLVRLLTLLMAILEYKAAAAIPHPTVLLLMSATMSPPELQGLVEYLVEQCDTWRNLNCSVPLSERWLHLVEPHRGAKWTVLEDLSDEAEVTQRVREIIDSAQHFTVVYRDSVDRLVRLQEALRQKGIPAVAVHSQMPESLQQAALVRLRSGAVRAALVTSVAEIGVEFERFGVPGVDRMVSINTGSTAKLVQRWGRLARQPHLTGVFHAIDVAGPRRGVCGVLANPSDRLDPGRTDYPSLIETTKGLDGEFYSAYRSPAADTLFARMLREAIKKLTGEVPNIYLGISERVHDANGTDSFSVPLGKLSAGAMQIDLEHWAEFRRHDGHFVYDLRAGRLNSRPRPLLVGGCQPVETCGTVQHSKLPQWLRSRGASGATLLKGVISLAMPNVAHGYRFESWVAQLQFPAGRVPVGPGFAYTDLHADLKEAFAPADVDVDLLARREQGRDVVFVYEPSMAKDDHLPVGAVEFIWSKILGGQWP